MYTYDRRYAALYARTFFAMSVQDAKVVLGFPPNANPTPAEIAKAYKVKAVQNHPDRGGDHQKMVDINVAKEILEGKRREDRTPYRKPQDPGVSPEETARRRAEIKREMDIGSIEIERDKAAASMARGLGVINSLFGAGWRADLKEFLTDDFADAVDKIHDEAEAGLKTTTDKASFEKILGLTQSLSSGALRLASKFSSLKKKLASVSKEATVAGLAELYADTAKFAAAFKALRIDSSKLQVVIVTRDAVPLVWDDIYSHSHQRIISYDEDFRHFSDSELKTVEAQVERCVDAVIVKLETYYGGTGDSSNWKWMVLTNFFQDAIETVKKAPKTANIAARVAARFKST